MGKVSTPEEKLMKAVGFEGWRAEVFYAMCHLSNAQDMEPSVRGKVNVAKKPLVRLLKIKGLEVP